ncbi:MAG: NAD(+)/NADH kinase [Candidatus Poribacteria bacterium]|nr:NAD(+)/NADH kinase [Candidatus Poribacteria bacterium]
MKTEAQFPFSGKSQIMKTVGFFVNTSKPKASQVVAATSDWLRGHGVQSLISDEQAASLGVPCQGRDQNRVVAESDLLLVLGGDGTLLSAAHTPQIENVPILAVNLGHLGFLTEVSLDELYPALTNILNGNYEIDQRMMLEINVDDHDRQHAHCFALNDVWMRHYTRLIELDTYIDGKPFLTYNADGLIIATPSGSTGYSLSTGGTIVEPHLNAILLTPIAPHSLTIRPFIAHGDSEITVAMRSDYSSVSLFVDGSRETYCLAPNSLIRVRKAKKTIKLIRSQRRSYYEVLRTKLMLGEGTKRKT